MRSELIEMFIGKEHTRENWLGAWDTLREKTALEPHGVELVDVADDSIRLRMEIGDHARQPFGLLHGGISMLLAETAASMHACWKIDVTERFPVGIEINGSHLHSATEGAVEVVATVVRRSKTIIHHNIEVRHVETEQLLCVGRVVNLYREFRTG